MYRILIQRDKKAIGVSPIIFKSSDEINSFMDKIYPDCFYSSAFSHDNVVKDWIKKYGVIKKEKYD